MEDLFGFFVLSLPYIVFVGIVSLSIAIIRIAPQGRARQIAVGLVLLVWFWDLPALGYFEYRCSSEGGFAQIMTLDEWIKANPGVAETIEPYRIMRTTEHNGVTRRHLNERFAREFIMEELLFDSKRTEKRLVDSKDEKTIARFVDFSMANERYSLWNVRAFKFWLQRESCWEQTPSQGLKDFSKISKNASDIREYLNER